MIPKSKTSPSSIFIFLQCLRIILLNPKGMFFYIGSKDHVLSLQGCDQLIGRNSQVGQNSHWVSSSQFQETFSNVIWLADRVCTRWINSLTIEFLQLFCNCSGLYSLVEVVLVGRVIQMTWHFVSTLELSCGLIYTLGLAGWVEFVEWDLPNDKCI